MSQLGLCASTLPPFLREPLVSEEQFERTLGSARGLPDAFRAFYLECRLSPPAPRVDLLAAATRPERPFVAAANTRESLHPFVLSWLEGQLAPEARYVWLERDDVPGAPQRMLGNVHVCVDAAYQGMRPGAGSALPEFDAAPVRRVMTDMAQCGLLADPQRELIEGCLGALPPAGRLIHVSAMRARSPVELKLYLALPPASFGDFARRLAAGFDDQATLLATWAIRAVRCRRLLRRYVPRAGSAQLGRRVLAASAASRRRRPESKPGAKAIGA
ncbi:MAG: hypothetical protein QM756_45105 [Polyangiaceae bacterium]